MQTIPNNVLALIVGQYPELQTLINELHENPQAASAIEQRMALEAMRGEIHSLTPSMMRDLAACAAGDPYGAQRNQTWILLSDARGAWVNIALATALSGGYDRTHLYRLARTGRLMSEHRNGEVWLKRVEVESLDRQHDPESPADVPGRRDVEREARRARLPRLKAQFQTVLERQALVNAVAGVGHRREFIRDLHEQVRIALLGSSYVHLDGLDLDNLLEKIRTLDEDDREALVRAMEYSWSRINRDGSLYPEGLFTDCL